MDRSMFSQRLKQLRSLQGISQYALADELGVSRTSLKNVSAEEQKELYVQAYELFIQCGRKYGAHKAAAECKDFLDGLSASGGEAK